MSLLAEKSKSYPAITGCEVGENTVTASMNDGREVSIPIAWFPGLAGGNQRAAKKI